MFKLSLKLMAGALLASTLLVGCGSSDNGDGQVSTGPITPTPTPTPPIEQTITAVVDYIRSLIASTGDNAEPTEVNGLTLAADDKAEPAVVN